MPISLAVLLFAPPGPPVFDQCLAALRARKAFSVGISLDALMNKNETKMQFSLAYQAPNKVLLTKLSNGRPKITFWLNGPRVLAYDPSAGEMTLRKAPLNGPVINRLANAIGGIEDPVAAQLSPDTMAAFLQPFRNLKGWTTNVRGDRIVVARPATVNGQKTLTSLEFSASSKLMTKALLIGPSTRLQWLFNYGPPPKNLSFSPPKGTKTVKALFEHARVTASDPRAQNLVDQSLRAYGRISSVAFSVSGTHGDTTDWIQGQSFREKQANVDWSYHGGILTIRDFGRGKSYRGRCKPSAILNYLKVLKRTVDPIMQAMISRRNPIRGWFLPGMTASSHGSVKIAGVEADAVEVASSQLNVSLLIRRDNQLVASVSSKVKDANGNVVSEANRKFTYWRVNQPLPASTFALPVTAPFPLTKIGK